MLAFFEHAECLVAVHGNWSLVYDVTCSVKSVLGTSSKGSALKLRCGVQIVLCSFKMVFSSDVFILF